MADQPVSETKSTRKRVDDLTFRRVCDEVAQSETPTINTIAERLGLKPTSVVQRRNHFNKTYREHGVELLPLPRGGGARKNVADLAAKMLAETAETADTDEASN